MSKVVYATSNEEFDLLANSLENTKRVIEIASKLFQKVEAIKHNISTEDKRKLHEFIKNISVIIHEVETQESKIGSILKMTDRLTMMSLRDAVIVEKYSKPWTALQCRMHTPMTVIKALQKELEKCVDASVDVVFLDLMAQYIGYKYSVNDQSVKRETHFGRDILGKYTKKHPRESQDFRLDSVLREMNLKYYKLYDVDCDFTYVLVNSGFQRSSIVSFAAVIAKQLVQLAHYEILCTYAKQNNYTFGDGTHELEKAIRPITDMLKILPAQILNSTWPHIQTRQIKEIFEEIPDSESDETESSFSSTAVLVYKHQARIGHPDYELQILMVPYSSEDLDQNPHFWYLCRPNVSQLVQRKKKFNVLAIRLEGSHEPSSNSSQLQNYIGTIQPTILNAFEKKYWDASTPKSVIYSLKFDEGIDLTKFEHHQGVILLHSKKYFSPCNQTMTFYHPLTNHTTSIQYFFDGEGDPLSFCHHWSLLFV